MASSTCATCGRPVPAGASCPHDGSPGRAPLTAAAPPGPPVDGEVEQTFIPPRGVGDRPTAALAVADEAGPIEATFAGDPLLGAQLGDYVVKEQLGEGGMGIVYAGEQPLIGKRVAIKVLRPEIARDPEQVQRLLAEARAVNAIRHRGIIDIFNFGELPDGRHYVVMEYLSGIPLDKLIAERGALPPVEALEILDEVLAALGAGHGAGIIHRDLKPSNVFLVRQPDGSRYVKLLDFGLAKVSAQPRGATPQTRTDMFVGTPEYVAPEQARAEPVGPYTDLYAAGVVSFELLTGQLPFTANSPIEWVMRHLDTIPPAPSSVAGGIPPELDAVVLRLLEKDQAKRPPSAETVRRELARIRRGLASAATQWGAGPPVESPSKARAALRHLPGPSTDTNSVPPKAAPQKAAPPPPNAEATLPAWAATGERPGITSQTLEDLAAVGPKKRPVALFAAAGVGAVVLLAVGVAFAVGAGDDGPQPLVIAPNPSLPSPPEVPPEPLPRPEPHRPVAAVPPVVPPPAPEPAKEVTPTPPRPVATQTRTTPKAVSAGPSPRPPREGAPSTTDLLSEIDRLEKALKRRGYEAGSLPMQFLERYRQEARVDSAEKRKELRGKLKAFEAKHVGT